MDELSIEALTAALQQAQQQKASARLSERNVVELVLKLQQLGLLGEDLLYTVNGREYLTVDQLRKEIHQLIQQSGGRIAVVDLPAQLNVDLSHCERLALELVSNSKGSLQLAAGELLSSGYFDALAAEVQELLGETGAVSIGNLARQFSLSVELVTSSISSRLGSVICAKLEGGMLYTPAFLTRVKVQLRGALRAALEPLYLQEVAKALGLQDISPSMLNGLVDELVRDGSLQGSLRSGLWTPTAHVKALQRQLDSFYQTNGYVTSAQASRCGMPATSGGLAQRLPGSISLHSAAVSESLLQRVEGAVQEAVQSNSWLDVTAEMPPDLSVEDAAALIQASDVMQGLCKQQAAQVFSGTCIVSSALLAGLQEKALQAARQAAREQSKRGKQPQQQQQQAVAPNKAGAGAAMVEDEDDDWDMGSKKGKKGGKKKAPAKGKTSKGSAAPVVKAAQSSGDDGSAALAIDQLTQLVLAAVPDFEEAGEDGSLAAAVAEVLRPAALAEYQAQVQAVFTAGADARRRRAQFARQKLESAHQKFQLYSGGVEDVAGKEEQLRILLARHLVRSTGAEMVNWLLRYMEASVADVEPADMSDSAWQEAAAVLMAPTDRTQLLQKLPKEEAAPAAAAAAALAAEPDGLQTAVEEAAKAAGVLLRALDKKGEKQLLALQRQNLVVALEAETEPAQALSLVVMLLVEQVCHKAVPLIGRAIGPVLSLLQPKLEERYEALAAYHALVVEDLKAQSEAADKRQADAREKLLQQLPGIKKLVLKPQAAAM